MSEEKELICRPTKWFTFRVALMFIMFTAFGVYFLYDWKVGYPKANYIVAHYKAFSAAGKAWESAENRENWAAYAARQKILFEDDRSIYPPGTDFDEKWPEILGTMSKANSEQLWVEYSGEKGWPQKVDPAEYGKPAYKIKEQVYAAVVCFLLSAVALFFFVRTKGRLMKVDSEGYYPPGGGLIPFGEMVSIDKRKWETKGLATIRYRDGGVTKKAKVDGMVYGQFKEEDGAPAEALFQRVLANFKGELIELVDAEEDEEGEAGVAENEVEVVEETKE